ncbi:MAG: TraR/DksA C4-type zinc finger protein [Acidiferrobacterales bacterium]|nr:TraR/DksA C4-type zinc finger protein [Acidiferrobacterales bacterium]
MSDIDLKYYEQRLLDEQERILGITELISEASKTVKLDQNRVGRLSRMDAMQSQAMAQAGAARQQRQLTLIENALNRIDDGEYGRCLNCDDYIANARLKIEPTSEYCIRCANRLET